MPEDGYHGEYVVEVARDIVAEHGDDLADLPEPERDGPAARRGRARGSSPGVERTLERFGVRFDVYFSEAELERKGEIAAAVERLRAADYAYDADGAVWFRSTAFGDDKDRVIVRSNGTHTYFGADCAYLDRQVLARLRPRGLRVGGRPPRRRRPGEGRRIRDGL